MRKTSKSKATKKTIKRNTQVQGPLQAVPEAMFSQARQLVSSASATPENEAGVAQTTPVALMSDAEYEALQTSIHPGLLLVYDCCQEQFSTNATPDSYDNGRLDIVHSLRRWFQYERVLGNGIHAETLLFSTKRSGRKKRMVAVKMLYDYEQDPVEYAAFLKEASIMERLKGYGHTVQFIRAKAYGSHFAIFMQFADMGTLINLLEDGHNEGFPTDTARQLLFEMTLGLAACEKEHIVHTDIKFDNIFCDSKVGMIIGDFGEAAPVSCFKVNYGTIQSFGFKSPEVRQEVGVYSHGVDVFCLGPLALLMMSGCVIKFVDDYEADLDAGLKVVLGEKYSEVGPKMMSFLTAVLRSDPLERPSALELVEHEVFADFMGSARYKKTLAKLGL